MADLLKSVAYTVLPDGDTIKYNHGALIKKRKSHRINVWYRWLHILKVQKGW